MVAVILAFGGADALADDGCPDGVEECMTVVGVRDSCPEGWTCSSERPDGLAAECYTALTDALRPPVIGRVGDPRSNGRQHNGIDLGVATGTPVYALKDGVVVDFEGDLPEGVRTTYNGNFVRVDYNDGTQGVFLHLASVAEELAVGDLVGMGDLLGISNDTGSTSSGPHLHYTEYNDQEGREVADPLERYGACG